MHQSRIVGDGLLTGGQQVDDLLERSASAQIERAAPVSDLAPGARILVRPKNPDRIAGRVKPRSEPREVFERPALGRPVLGTRHHGYDRACKVQAEIRECP